jgi:hypothetical protein
MKKMVKLTEQDLEKLVKKIIKEEGEEYSSEDPDQLDMFDGTKVKDRELEQEFYEVIKDFRGELDWPDENDMHEILYNKVDEMLEDVFGGYLQDLENWVRDNKENMNKSLYNKAILFVEAFESGMFEISVKYTREAEELLSEL